MKWAGGKTQFISKISEKVSEKEYERFVEPFVGGGSVFLHILPKKLWINDLNPLLVNMYLIVKNKPDDLIAKLKTMIEEMNNYEIPKDAKKRGRKDVEKSPDMIQNEYYYYHIRDVDLETCSDIDKAAIFIFLNKTCFRGLYRENSSGKFNVPFGNYKNPPICDEKNIRGVSKYLNDIDAKITNLDYKLVIENLTDTDFVYLDPPYYPKNTTSFTKYTKDDFSIEEQKNLVKYLVNMKNNFLLSNFPHPDLIAEFSKDGEPLFEYDVFCARRAINVNQGKEKEENNEILVWN